MHNLLSAQQDTEKAISEGAILLNEDKEFKLFSTNQNWFEFQNIKKEQYKMD